MNKQESTYDTLSKGCLLKGKSYDYYIEGVLGQGSFGITYLASARMSGELGSLNTGTRVAIKEFFMRDINGRDGTSVTSGSKHGIYEDYKRKFKREALNLSMLNHPDIVKVVEMFEANSTAYYVMEYIDGGSLNNYIDEHGPLNENTAVALCTKIGSALAFMHSKGILHLDLKPSNIMMRRDGTPVLIDFGLSKQYDNNGEPESSTNVGLGTPGYAPIEQADYHDGKGFPVTMDVYALGATMFKMLTGQRPPEASSILNDGFPYGLLKKHGVSTSVIKAVESAMNPVRGNRCISVKDFIYLLCNGDNNTLPDTNDEIIPNVINHNVKIGDRAAKQYVKSKMRKSTFIRGVVLFILGAIFSILRLFPFFNIIPYQRVFIPKPFSFLELLEINENVFIFFCIILCSIVGIYILSLLIRYNYAIKRWIWCVIKWIIVLCNVYCILFLFIIEPFYQDLPLLSLCYMWPLYISFISGYMLSMNKVSSSSYVKYNQSISYKSTGSYDGVVRKVGMILAVLILLSCNFFCIPESYYERELLYVIVFTPIVSVAVLYVLINYYNNMRGGTLSVIKWIIMCFCILGILILDIIMLYRLSGLLGHDEGHFILGALSYSLSLILGYMFSVKKRRR